MAAIFGIVYPDENMAEQALNTVAGLQEAGLLKVLEVVWLDKNEDGEVKVHDKPHPVFGKAAGGAVLGGIVGLLFLVPVVGLAIGAIAGGLLGHSMKTGGEEDFKAFADIIGESMKPGNSAIVVFGETNSPAKVADELGKWGGALVSTEMSPERVAEYQTDMDRSSKS